MTSVCIATYNGEIYIEKQINSILKQLENDDEVIIVDDNSTDKTLDIIKNIQDTRIHLFYNTTNQGHVKSFEKAILNSNGDYIFLSDQDDFWLNNRVSTHINILKSNDSLLTISNMQETSLQGNYEIIKKFEMPKSNFLLNIYNILFGKSLYFGSLMCFKKDLKNIILPFPNFILAHDIYIAFIANSYSSIIHIDQVLLLRTNTGNNLSYKKRSIFKKIIFKIFILKCLFVSFKHFKID